MTNNFHNFYTTWLNDHRKLIHQLKKSQSTEEHKHEIHNLIQKTLSHYTDYYRVKSQSVKVDVLQFFSAPWSTALERSLQWIGGWRPTTAFHLVYTESSILFESHVVDILRGCRTGDLGDLSPDQFRRVSELQCDTVRLENDITDELADWQDGASSVIYGGEIENKMDILIGILEKADHLRVKTIESLVEMLTPRQAAEFLVAGAELHLGIRDWGIEQDRLREML